MNYRMSFKTFCIILVMVLGILYLGYQPREIQKAPEAFPAPNPGEWCLGYDYKENRYRYDTSPESKPRVIPQYEEDPFEEFDLRRSGFTREQAKSIMDMKGSNTQDIDIEDVIDNLEYYR